MYWEHEADGKVDDFSSDIGKIITRWMNLFPEKSPFISETFLKGMGFHKIRRFDAEGIRSNPADD